VQNIRENRTRKQYNAQRSSKPHPNAIMQRRRAYRFAARYLFHTRQIFESMYVCDAEIGILSCRNVKRRLRPIRRTQRLLLNWPTYVHFTPILLRPTVIIGTAKLKPSYDPQQTWPPTRRQNDVTLPACLRPCLLGKIC